MPTVNGSIRYLPGLILLGIGCLGLANTGCFLARPSMAPKEAALSTLRSALEAWKKGEKPEELEKSALKISASDLDWLEGKRLTKFEIDETRDMNSGLDRKFEVKLWLEGSDDEPKVVRYTVLVTPIHRIIREFEGPH